MFYRKNIENTERKRLCRCQITLNNNDKTIIMNFCYLLYFGTLKQIILCWWLHLKLHAVRMDGSLRPTHLHPIWSLLFPDFQPPYTLSPTPQNESYCNVIRFSKGQRTFALKLLLCSMQYQTVTYTIVHTSRDIVHWTTTGPPPGHST